MIDWEKSAELNGCTVRWLKDRFEKYPKSNKRIISICDDCEKVREVTFCDYGDLCKSCAGKKIGLNNLGKNNPMYGKSGILSPRYGVEHTEETRKKISVSHKGLLTGENNPAKQHDARKKISESKIEFWKSPFSDKLRGGKDIVKHHYIYDHSDLTKYTMEVTRAKHTQIHAWMRKAGIVVPHINIKGV